MHLTCVNNWGSMHAINRSYTRSERQKKFLLLDFISVEHKKRYDKKQSKSFGVHCYSCSENTFQSDKIILSSAFFRYIGPTL